MRAARAGWRICCRTAAIALRTLRQKPGFAAVALLTLALGIGATTVMFTVINGVLLKPLPYPDPSRLVTVHGQTETATALYGELWAFAYPEFRRLRAREPLARHGGVDLQRGHVSEPGEAEYVDGSEISSDLFSVLGVPLFRGRAFLPEEDRPGGAPVAMIISYGLWQRRFGGRPGSDRHVAGF